MAKILLPTLNARYIHTAFELRYLFANLGALQDEAKILEVGIQERPADIVEKLLRETPEIIGFGVYVWNVSEINAAVALLKQIAPDIVIVLGGPEVSHPPDLPGLAERADYIITGAGELSFRRLCERLLNGERPSEKLMAGEVQALDGLASPYPFYSDNDIRNRIVYVEASRGCPFKCEFCLSALDKTAEPFALEPFLAEMDALYRRGARHFKFIDRTFNLKVDTSVAILEFFLERMTDGLYLHFEVIPDNLPSRLKETLIRFPSGSLQFEVGVQTFDPAIQRLISRKQDNAKTRENLFWLREHTQAHVHADLIFGLPGDTLENFAQSFDQLVVLKPQEIQLGILKRLRGAPINRHNQEYRLSYHPEQPYTIVSTRDIDFFTLQRVTRFARFWDRVGNSGRFSTTLPLILDDRPFERFLQFSDALHEQAGSTWKIALKRLFELTFTVMTESLTIDPEAAAEVLASDYLRTGEKGGLTFLQPRVAKKSRRGLANKRQRNYV